MQRKVPPPSRGPYGVQRPSHGPGSLQESYELTETSEGSNPTMRILLLAAVVLCLGLVFVMCRERPLPAAGPFPAPQQTKLPQRKQLPGPKDYTIWATHSYELKALILSRKRYNDESTFLAPVDFALAWGPITKQEHINTVSWSQGRRWYYFRRRKQNAPPNSFFAHNSANTHIIPAFDKPEIRDTLLRFRRGQAVSLKGYLVFIRSKKRPGWRWKSSTSRTDTGGGACEVFYVTEAEAIPLQPS